MPNANLLSIKDLNGKTFRIPAYQRGYRWTRRQIKDLVCDLSEFSKSRTSRIYCLQPIVLEKRQVRTAQYITTLQTVNNG